MSDLMFFLKCLGFTVILILGLQVTVGGRTIEERTLSWAHESSLLQPLHKVADAAVVLIEDGWRKLTGKSAAKISHAEPVAKSRLDYFKLERNQAVIDKQVSRRRAQAEALAKEEAIVD